MIGPRIKNTDSDEVVSACLNAFDVQLGFLARAREALLEMPDKLGLVSSTLIRSAHTLGKGTLRHLRDTDLHCAMPLARAFFETLLNGSYVAVQGETAAELAFDHFAQRLYRDVFREMPLPDGTVAITRGIQKPTTAPPGFKDAVDRFTSKTGKEMTWWIDKSVEQRIECIETAIGVNAATYFRLLHHFVYGRASEILHGTFVGGAYAIGMSLPLNFAELETLGEKQNKGTCSVLGMMCSLVVENNLRIAGREFKSSKLKSIADESGAINDALKGFVALPE